MSEHSEKIDYFDENAAQCSVREYDAFGIHIHSRYSRCGEFIEMMQFCQAAALAGVNGYVKELSFDSKACLCHLEMHENVENGDLVFNTLVAVADRHLSQYMINGDGECRGFENPGAFEGPDADGEPR